VTGVELDPVEIQVLQDLTILSSRRSSVERSPTSEQSSRPSRPRVLQPYYDIAKLFCKETLVPEEATGLPRRPVVAFACYLTVRCSFLSSLNTLCPRLHGDILAEAYTLLAASQSAGSARERGSYPVGSRAMTFGALIQPSILFVTFTVALVTATDLPYFEAAAVRSSLAGDRSGAPACSSGFFSSC